MIRDVARLFRKSNAMKDPKRNLQLLADGNLGCTDSQYKIAKLILDNGGDLNIRNNNNMPALRSTIKHSRDGYRLMKLFFMYNLDDEIISDLEKTAEIVGNRQVIELIEQRKEQRATE